MYNQENNFFFTILRGSIKLNNVLNKYPLAIIKAVALDIGSSSGGFVQVISRYDLRKLYTVDLVSDTPGVSITHKGILDNLTSTNILSVHSSYFHPKPQVITVDISFISILRVLKKISEIASRKSIIYVLVKTQFETNALFIHKFYRYTYRLAILNAVYFMKIKLHFTVIGIFVSNIPNLKKSIEYWVVLEK